MKVQSSNLWYSPPRVYRYIDELNRSGVKLDNKLNQQVEEIRLASVAGLVMYALNGMPAFVQLHDDDPPDAIVLQTKIPSDGIAYTTLLEITTYTGAPKESLLSRLKRKKIPEGRKVLSPEHVLIVNLGIGFDIDDELQKIKDHMDQNKVDFPVWILQEKSVSPDSIAEVIIIDNQIKKLNINIGVLAYEYNNKKIYGVIETKRRNSKETPMSLPNTNKYPPPWETIGK